MKELQLKVQTLTPAIAQELEQLRLISFLHHPPAASRRILTKGYIKGDNFPAAIHGFHSVTIAHTDILLSSHPPGQDEIVFLWEYEAEVKPLYFVFAKHKRTSYLKALGRQELTPADFVALRPPLNDPQWSNFIVWNGTVHCELTDALPPQKMAPSFYVLEPLDLSVQYTEEHTYGLHLSLVP